MQYNAKAASDFVKGVGTNVTALRHFARLGLAGRQPRRSVTSGLTTSLTTIIVAAEAEEHCQVAQLPIADKPRRASFKRRVAGSIGQLGQLSRL